MSVTAPAPEPAPEAAPARSRQVDLYVGLVLLLFGLDSRLAALPVQFYLKDRLHLGPQALALFVFVTDVPAYVAFLFGYLRDRWRPRGWGDRAYLLGAGLLSAAGYLSLAAGRLTYARLLGAMLLLAVLWRVMQAAIQAVTTAVAQRDGKTGELSAVLNQGGSAPAALACLAGGWLTAQCRGLSRRQDSDNRTRNAATFRRGAIRARAGSGPGVFDRVSYLLPTRVRSPGRPNDRAGCLSQMSSWIGERRDNLEFREGIDMLATWVVAALMISTRGQDVFVSGHGFDTYRIPAICRTTRGCLLAFAEGRGSVADQAQNVIVVRRRAAGSRRWSDERVLADARPDTLNNPCVLATGSGRVWLMYQRYPAGVTERSARPGYEPGASCRSFVMSSGDDGRTWSAPQELTRTVRPEAARTVASGPGVGIELTRGRHRGRMLFPFNAGTGEGWEVFSVYSDDQGRTWRRGEPAPEAPGTQPNEVQFAELADGRVVLNARNQSAARCRLQAFSNDGGAAWSTVTPRPDLPDPGCMGSILRLSFRPDLLLFSNPASEDRRENGTVRLARDGGRTWDRLAVVEPGSFGYSCLVRLSSTTAGLLYETVETGAEGRPSYRIRFTEIPVPADRPGSAEAGTVGITREGNSADSKTHGGLDRHGGPQTGAFPGPGGWH